MDKKNTKNIAGTLLAVLVIAGIYWFIKHAYIDFTSFTPAAMRDYLRGFGRWSAVVYVLAYAFNTISLLPPIGVLSFTAGLVFGKVLGAILLMLGSMLGTSATFFISRFFVRSLVERSLQGKFKKLDETLGKKGFAAVLFFRAIPLVPYEVLNYAGGLSKIKFRDYFFATFLGIIPGVLIAVYFGDALGEVRGFKDLASFNFIFALIGLAALMLAPFIYLHLKKGRGENGS